MTHIEHFGWQHANLGNQIELGYDGKVIGGISSIAVRSLNQTLIRLKIVGVHNPIDSITGMNTFEPMKGTDILLIHVIRF